MTERWPVALFAATAGLWLLRAACLPDERWSRLSYNWPVPWPRMRPRSQRLIRAACWLGGAVAIACGAGIAFSPR